MHEFGVIAVNEASPPSVLSVVVMNGASSANVLGVVLR